MTTQLRARGITKEYTETKENIVKMRNMYEKHKDDPITTEYIEYISLVDQCHELGHKKYYKPTKKDIKTMKKWIAEHKDDKMGPG